MAPQLNRRKMLGLGVGGAVAVTGVGFGVRQAFAEDVKVAPAATAEEAAELIKAVFDAEAAGAGGWWRGVISVVGADGSLKTAVDQEADPVLEAWSTNKVPVAIAVLDKVDRGEVAIDQLLDVTEEIVAIGGDGIFGYDDAYPSHVTVGHVLANMVTVSDNTAVRLCGKLISAEEINTFMAAKGFPNTQVEQKDDVPDQFWLGTTTPREQHDLWHALSKGELLSAESTQRLFTLLRSPEAFTDGIRLRMPTNDRLRVATKAGWFDDEVDERCEVGIMYDPTGAPVLIYSIYAGEQGALEDFGANHPAIAARGNMGTAFLTIVGSIDGAAEQALPIPEYKPLNG